MRRVVLALALLLAASCTNEGATYYTLRAAGYKPTAVGGWAMFGCSDSDGTCTEFEAIGPSGASVRGVVGCGYFFKGCTIRITGGAP